MRVGGEVIPVERYRRGVGRQAATRDTECDAIVLACLEKRGRAFEQTERLVYCRYELNAPKAASTDPARSLHHSAREQQCRQAGKPGMVSVAHTTPSDRSRRSSCCWRTTCRTNVATSAAKRESTAMLRAMSDAIGARLTGSYKRAAPD